MAVACQPVVLKSPRRNDCCEADRQLFHDVASVALCRHQRQHSTRWRFCKRFHRWLLSGPSTLVGCPTGRTLLLLLAQYHLPCGRGPIGWIGAWSQGSVWSLGGRTPEELRHRRPTVHGVHLSNLSHKTAPCFAWPICLPLRVFFVDWKRERLTLSRSRGSGRARAPGYPCPIKSRRHTRRHTQRPDRDLVSLIGHMQMHAHTRLRYTNTTVCP